MTPPHAADAEILVATVRRPGDRRPLSVLDRARRTGAAARACAGWVWPQWWERQTRATHPAFVPPGELGLLDNRTGRSWASVGTTASGAVAVVDPAGLVVPAGGGWSLDWAVRAEDRWHVASREPAVRQRVGAVFETILRVPGGDVRHRVHAVPGDRRRGDLVVVEVRNDSPVPVAVAFALRPADVLGAGTIASLAVDDAGMRIDERPVLSFDRAPAGRALSVGPTGDSWCTVLGDAAGVDGPRDVHCPWGMAQGAVVIPVPHTATVRVVLAPEASRRAEAQRPSTSIDADAVARGWARHLERGATLVLPDDALVSAHAAAVRRLLLAVRGAAVPVPLGLSRWDVADETAVVTALALAGFGADVAPVLVAGCDEQRVGSWLRRGPNDLAGLVPVLEAVAAHWHACGDRTAARAVLGSTVKALQWAIRRHQRGDGADAAIGARLVAAARALPDIARAIDLPDTADDLEGFLLVVEDAVRVDTTAAPPDGQRAPDAEAVGTGAPDAPAAVGDDVAVPTDHEGEQLAAGAATAAARLHAGDETGLALLRAVLGTTNEGPWPTRRHPRTGGGSAGAGDDPRVAAAVLDAVRAAAVRVDGPDATGAVALHLLPVFPAAWLGQAVDVRDLPTPAGPLSYSLRWHGARAALLWEVGAETARPVRLTCGLDPGWSSDAARGEALLAAPAPAMAPAAPAASTATTPSASAVAPPTASAAPPAEGESFG